MANQPKKVRNVLKCCLLLSHQSPCNVTLAMKNVDCPVIWWWPLSWSNGQAQLNSFNANVNVTLQKTRGCFITIRALIAWNGSCQRTSTPGFNHWLLSLLDSPPSQISTSLFASYQSQTFPKIKMVIDRKSPTCRNINRLHTQPFWTPLEITLYDVFKIF